MNFQWSANRMGSFSVLAVGRLARNPETFAEPEGQYCRFCLTSEDATEDDAQGRFAVIVQSVWFVATHLIGAALFDGVRKGDQLFVQAKIRQQHWTGRARKEEHTLVVTGYRFGARRGDRDGSGMVPKGAPEAPAAASESAVVDE